MPQKEFREYTEYFKDNFTPNKVKEKIEDKNKYCLITEKDGFIIAYCEIDRKVFLPENKLFTAEITVLHVSEHSHKQDIGKACF